jgi:hypothetical protein
LTSNRPESQGDVMASIRACAAAHGLFPAHHDEITRGREIAARRIGPLIASASTLAAVQARNGASVFAYRKDGATQGFLAILPLGPSGLRKIEQDAFNALEPDLEDVCRDGDAVAAVYAWGIAAETVRASAAVVLCLIAMHQQAAPKAPFFCRAATPAGAKITAGKLGYAPYPPSKTGMLFKPARVGALECAA